MSEKIFGRWGSFETMLNDFKDTKYDYDKDCDDPGYVTVTELSGPVPTEDELLFASYGGGAYEGDATVIFQKDGKLYEAGGSHCSCNGLENQWNPTETTWEALSLRVTEMEKNAASSDSFDIRYGPLGEHEEEAKVAFMALVRSHVPSA